METELTESVTHARAALGAATIAEAFRITAGERAGEVAIRTKGTSSPSPGESCASVSTRSPAVWPSSASSAATASR